MEIKPTKIIDRCNHNEPDAIISFIDGVDIPVNKEILSSASSFFKFMFLSGMNREIRYSNGVPTYGIGLEHSPEIDSVINYMYGCTIKLEGESFLILFHLSKYFGIDDLTKQLTDSLGTFLMEDNSLAGAIIELTYNQSFHDLNKYLFDFIILNFSRVDISKISHISLLKDILSNDNIDVRDESSVINSLQTWMEANPHKIDELNTYLVPYIRLPTIKELARILKYQGSVLGNFEMLPNFKLLVEEADNYQPDYHWNLPERRNILRTVPSVTYFEENKDALVVLRYDGSIPEEDPYGTTYPTIEIAYFNGRSGQYERRDIQLVDGYEKIGEGTIIKAGNKNYLSINYIANVQVVYGRSSENFIGSLKQLPATVRS